MQDDVDFPRPGVGGPIFDSSGHAVGFVGPVGVGLTGTWGGYDVRATQEAVPIKAAIGDLTWFSKHGPTPRTEHGKAYFGVAWQQLSKAVAQTIGTDVPAGLLVTYVLRYGPAYRAGIRSGNLDMKIGGTTYHTGGDVIVAVDGQQVRTSAQMRRLIAAHKPGDTASIGLVRNGKPLTVHAKLTWWP